MKKLMNTLMLSCKKASALVIKRNDFELTLREKIQLFFHLMMCDACHNFDKQNKVINRALEEDANQPVSTQDEQASGNLKDRIISKLP